MTKEEAIKILDDYEIVPMDFPYNTREEVGQAFCMAIDALNALPTQAENYAQGFADGYKRGMKDADRPSGHWIENDSDTWVCSECGVENAYAVYRGRICDNYCPHCGARMKGEQDANND